MAKTKSLPESLPARFLPAAGERRTIYLEYPNGALSKIETDALEVTLPEGVVELTAEQFAERMAELDAEREASRGRTAEVEGARQRAEYDALTGLGVPEALAARLTGYGS